MKGCKNCPAFAKCTVTYRGPGCAALRSTYGVETDPEIITNADRIRAMDDKELAEFLMECNPANCQQCAFSYGWRCDPDREDYSDAEKCTEGRKRWLQQPAEEEQT